MKLALTVDWTQEFKSAEAAEEKKLLSSIAFKVQNGWPQYYFLNQHLQEYENKSPVMRCMYTYMNGAYKRKKRQQKQSPVMMILHI